MKKNNLRWIHFYLREEGKREKISKFLLKYFSFGKYFSFRQTLLYLMVQKKVVINYAIAPHARSYSAYAGVLLQIFKRLNKTYKIRIPSKAYRFFLHFFFEIYRFRCCNVYPNLEITCCVRRSTFSPSDMVVVRARSICNNVRDACVSEQ